MVPFAVPTDEEYFVLDVARAVEIEAEDLVCESLPLGFGTLRVKLRIVGICLVDQSEICGHLFQSPHI